MFAVLVESSSFSGDVKLHQDAPWPIETEGSNSAATAADFTRYALDAAAIVAITDVQGTITYVNDKFCEVSGYSREELIGNNHRIICSGLHSKAFFRDLYRCIASGQTWRGEICNHRKDGKAYWVDTTIVPHLNRDGKPDSYTSIRFDVTARHEAEEHLRQIVDLDPLTGIANRRRFQSYLEAALERHDQARGAIHLALIDVDAFKEINDTFGHDVGDSLLKVIALRLADFQSEGAFIARLGGDEFGIITSDNSDAVVGRFLDDVLKSIKSPIWLGGVKHRYSASIGIASFPDQASSAEDLFKAADMALYQAKASGRDQRSFYTPRLRRLAEQKSELLQAVEAGLSESQFHLYYQPIVPLDPSKPIYLEALLRWRHPERGLLLPGAFLTGIDDPGLEAAIGMFVVEAAFKDLAFMREQGIPIGRVAINATNADFRSDQFVDRFLSLSAQTQVTPDSFCIEVVEQVFLGSDYQGFRGRLARLHEAGVEIALDDFGTGYASLSHLRRIPIDRLKIDRSFVSNLPESSADLAIVEGVIGIAHALGKSVTAEGVETLEQASLLMDLGCDFLQGWYFAKASNRERLPHILANLPPVPSPADDEMLSTVSRLPAGRLGA